jgi:probable F420-dependent oxidoreductase
MTSHRPFRFSMSGTQWGPQDSGTDQRTYLQSEATRAEAAGFDVLTFADHTVAGMRPPLTTILCAAEAARSLRFGTMVLNNDFWNPLLLAREAAAISVLTGGRFELGIGAGHAKPDYDNAGLRYDPPRVRVDRLAEALPLLQQLLHGETVTHQGTHYSLVDANTGLPEGTTPNVPLLIGGNGTRVLRLAGKYAHTVGLTGLVRNVNFGHVHQPDWTAEYLDGRIDVVREAAGSRFGDIELNGLLQWVFETDDREAAAAGFCKEVEPEGIHLSVDDAMNTPFLLFGTIDEMADSLIRSRERFGITYFTSRPDGFDTLAKVMAKVRASSP